MKDIQSGIIDVSDVLLWEIEDYNKRKMGYQKMHNLLDTIKDKKRLKLYRDFLMIIKHINIQNEKIEQIERRSV